MHRLILLLAALIGALLSLPATANDYPDYLTFGGGISDFDKNHGGRSSIDTRIEYQNGISLLPLISQSFDSVDPYFQIHPTVGFEANMHSAAYANGGLNLDVRFLTHGIFTWGEAAGLFERGDDERLGSMLEFRSQLEVGWQFDNQLRVTGYISHISNADIVRDNAGAEIIGGYTHIPFSILGLK